MTPLEKIFGVISGLSAVGLGYWTLIVAYRMFPVLRRPMIDSTGKQMVLVSFVDYPMVRWQVIAMLAITAILTVGLAWLGVILFFSRRDHNAA